MTGSMTVPGEHENPRQYTVHKTMSPQQLLAQRSCTVRQDCPSLAITGSKNKYSTVWQELKSSGN